MRACMCACVCDCCTDHSNSLQVHLGPPQLLPAVVLVALSLGHSAELAGGFKNIADEGTPAYLIGRHLHRAVGGGAQRSAKHVKDGRQCGRGGRELETRSPCCDRRGGNMLRVGRCLRTHLGVSRVFWAQDLQSLAVGFALRVVNVTEKPCCPAKTFKNDSYDKESISRWENIPINWHKHILCSNDIQSISPSSHPVIRCSPTQFSWSFRRKE